MLALTTGVPTRRRDSGARASTAASSELSKLPQEREGNKKDGKQGREGSIKLASEGLILTPCCVLCREFS